MKKELKEFLKRQPEENEYFRINNICYLNHWIYTNPDGSKNPEKEFLRLEFDNINNVNFAIYDTYIRSRDYDLIINEISALIDKFMDEVKSRLISDLKAGYRNKI